MTLSRDAILALDRAHVWHPYTSVDDGVDDGVGADPIVVARADGSWLVDVDGRRYLDGNASWWVATLGHGHPRLVRALTEQAQTLAHVAFAGTTHEPAAALARDLVAVAPPGLEKVFFTDNGSTAIEVAIKIAVQLWANEGRPAKTRFLALDGAFHGETLGATALGGVDVFKKPFAGVLFDCVHAPFPAEGAYAAAFDALTSLVRREHETIAAVFVEPLVQGASGMRMYPPSFLHALRDVTRKHDVLLVVDEVFTGYGRTGAMWACEHAGITPDMLCTGKAFASLLPMAATLATERVFGAFRGGKDKTLWYGHTFCGNPLGAAVAREVLAVYRDEDVVGQAVRKAPRIAKTFDALRDVRGVARVRHLGMIGALDLAGGVHVDMGYLGELGWKVYAEAKARGAYLRPLGDTVYVCPPLTIEDADLDRLLDIVDASVRAALG
jgi:adenosylmethionine-8-amino-7-oxononanoate aminotransferase